MKESILIFTDGSVNTKLKYGYGAYIISSEASNNLEEFKNKVKLKKFEETSSTKLELQILLHALSETKKTYNLSEFSLKIYTDSQNIVGLNGRKEKLEENNYFSKSGKRLNNHELYKEFYKITNGLDLKIAKVSGHKPTSKKSDIDKIFNLVDKASRKALRITT